MPSLKYIIKFRLAYICLGLVNIWDEEVGLKVSITLTSSGTSLRCNVEKKIRIEKCFGAREASSQVTIRFAL